MRKIHKVVLGVPLLAATLISLEPCDNNKALANGTDLFGSAKSAQIESVLKPTIVAYSMNGLTDKTGIAVSYSLNVRSNPWGATIGILKQGDKIEVIDTERDWLRINYNGKKAYVHSSWVSIDGYDYSVPLDGFLLDGDVDCYDEDGKIIGKIDEEKKVDIIADADKFWLIKTDEGMFYVLKGSVDCDDTRVETEADLDPNGDDKEENDDQTGDTLDKAFEGFVAELDNALGEDEDTADTTSPAADDEDSDNDDGSTRADGSHDDDNPGADDEDSDDDNKNVASTEASSTDMTAPAATFEKKETATSENKNNTDLSATAKTATLNTEVDTKKTEDSTTKTVAATKPAETKTTETKASDKAAATTKTTASNTVVFNQPTSKEELEKLTTKKEEKSSTATKTNTSTATKTTKTAAKNETCTRTLQSKKVTLPTGEKIYFLDCSDVPKKWKVEKGADCTILESNGKFAMIDCGISSSDLGVDNTSRIWRYVKELGAKKLEFMLISHTHGDHDGCLAKLVSKGLKIKTFYVKNDGGKYSSDIKTAKKAGATIYTVEKHKSTKFKFGNMNIELVGTKKNGGGKNENSVGIVATVHGKKLFFSGDMQNTKSKKYADDIAKQVGAVDLYKAAHHGYTNPSEGGMNNSEKTLSYLKPKYVVVHNTNRRLNSSKSKFVKRATKYTNKKNIYFAGSGTVVVNVAESGKITIKQLDANK